VALTPPRTFDPNDGWFTTLNEVSSIEALPPVSWHAPNCLRLGRLQGVDGIQRRAEVVLSRL
jgi:hypothetical protein